MTDMMIRPQDHAAYKQVQHAAIVQIVTSVLAILLWMLIILCLAFTPDKGLMRWVIVFIAIYMLLHNTFALIPIVYGLSHLRDSFGLERFFVDKTCAFAEIILTDQRYAHASDLQSIMRNMLIMLNNDGSLEKQVELCDKQILQTLINASDRQTRDQARLLRVLHRCAGGDLTRWQQYADAYQTAAAAIWDGSRLEQTMFPLTLGQHPTLIRDQPDAISQMHLDAPWD